jgi:HK97 family phage major capsid protein
MAANKEHLKALLEEATSIAERATRDGRSMTAAERTAVEAKLDQVQAGKSELQLVQAVDELNGRYGLGVATTGLGTAGSIGSAILSSPAFADRRRKGFSGQWSTGPIEVPFGAKADLTEAASPVIPPEFLRGVVETAFRKLTVQDLLASGTTDSNQVNVATETVATNAAAAIAEGAAKPESTLTLAMVAEPVRKCATFLPVSDEMLDDLSQARSYIDGRLRLFVAHAMEAQLLSGTGTAPQLRGLLNRTGVQIVTTTAGLMAAKIIQAIYDAVSLIRTNANLEPDGCVIHPTNWASVRTATDTNGQYFGGGPFTGAYGVNGIAPERIWNLPAVVTSAIPAGTALVGAFKDSAQVFLRGGLVVEASNAHADYFQRDMTALRAEQRAALAVYRPAGLVKITLTA